nr:hypothetical protein [uncultured Flavobacterium sp.]
MKTYFKKNNITTRVGLMLTVGIASVSCTSLNANYYDTDGIYNAERIKAPVTHNETAYYEEYFSEKKNADFEIFTDVDNYTSYENGYYPGWGESNNQTNIYINNGYNSPYWGWNNYYPSYGWNLGFGYNSYWGWNMGFGYGGYYGWGNPYYFGGYPYYGNGWHSPYYRVPRNVSYSNNTRYSSNSIRNSRISDTRNSTSNNRSGRMAIENSRVNATRLSNFNNGRIENSRVNTINDRNINTRTSNIRNTDNRINTRNTNNNFNRSNTRGTTIQNTPSRANFQSAPMRSSNSGGGRMSSGRR